MAFKFVAFFAFVAAASAIAIPQHYDHHYDHYDQPALIKSYQPVIKKVVEYKHEEHHHEEPANYDFEYSVHDDHTGDIKEQHETAKDGNIEGYYTLYDADGYKRIVHYHADHKNGFHAEVRREPVEGHKVVKQVAPVVVKKIVAAPVVHKYVAPVQHHHYEAQAHHYVAPVVAKVVAPVKYENHNHDSSSHVSFKGPSSNYHY